MNKFRNRKGGFRKNFCAAAGRALGRLSSLEKRMPGAGKATAAFLRERFHRFHELEQEQRSQILRWTVSCVLMVTVTVGSVVTVTASARFADITIDGVEKPKVEIVSGGTDEILSLVNFVPSGSDLVSRKTDSSGTVKITVRTFMRVAVIADGGQVTARLHYGDTVGDALAQAGVAVDGNDSVTPPVQTAAADGMTVQVLRRKNVTVTADGKTAAATVDAGTVAQALVQTGTAVGPDDTTSVSAQTGVTDGMNIKVTRVVYKDLTLTEAIPFRTVVRNDPTTTANVRKVQTAGQNGVRTVVTRQKLCDGVAVGSTVLSSAVTAQPVDQVELVGTMSRREGTAQVSGAGTLTDKNGRTVSYRKLLTGRCTAYTGGGTTSTGRRAAYGLVAVNPKIIPYGTRLYIASPGGGVVYGYAVAADTGGAAMSNRIVADLYYDTYSGCEQIGSRTMNVYVLD